jgi:hypothetical protein
MSSTGHFYRQPQSKAKEKEKNDFNMCILLLYLDFSWFSFRTGFFYLEMQVKYLLFKGDV